MKVDAAKAFTAFDAETGDWFCPVVWYKDQGGYDGKGRGNKQVRVIRESDWRKIQRKLRATDHPAGGHADQA